MKWFFSLWKRHKCLTELFPLQSNTYLMSTAITNILILSVRGPTIDVRIWRLQIQILMSIDDPRTERVKHAKQLTHWTNSGLMLALYQLCVCWVHVNPLSHHDALKHHVISLNTDLIFLKLGVLAWKFPWKWFTNSWQFSLMFHSLQVIFIHYKSRIATAIHGL